jgi:hypothetical protein
MAFPVDQLDLVTELFVGGAWQDISADVLLRDGVTIRQGKASEDGTVPPCSARMTLKNTTGNYSPRNPLGAWYGTLNRNTPIRQAIRVGRDTFTRTTSGGWGTSDTGQTWTLAGGGGTVLASDWNVASGVGTQSVPTTLANRSSFLGDLAYQDVEVAVTVTLTMTDVTGGALEPANVILRSVSISDYLMARVTVETNETVKVALMSAGGTVYASAVTVTGLTHSSAQALRVRAQIEGQTMRAKVWAVTAGEPYDWHVTAHIDAEPVAGLIGVRSGVSATNTNTKPVVFSYDNLVVTVPRFAGEVAEWPPRWDTSANDASVPIEAAGVLRRLGQGKGPALSAPRRYYVDPPSGAGGTVVAYWPLEDGRLSGVAQPAVGTQAMELFGLADREFGHGDLASWLTPVCQFVGIETTYGELSMPGFTAGSGWSVDMVRAGGRGGETVLLINTGTPTAFAGFIEVRFKPATDQIDVTLPGVGSPVTVTNTTIHDEAVHHVQFRAQGSGTVVWSLRIDEAVVSSGSYSDTLAAVYAVSFQDLSPHYEPLAVGHIAVYRGLANRPPLQSWDPPLGFGGAGACFGFRGEHAGRRIQRLCGEAGIPFSYIGDLDDTVLMGPQPAAPLLDILQQCVDADLGVLYESRGTLGFVYRTKGSMYSQSPDVEIDLEAGQVAPSLEPQDDDRGTRNDIKVDRIDGGTYQVEQTTGRLSVADPATGGVGRYDTSRTVNVYSDVELTGIGDWLLHLGTVDEARYPMIPVEMASSGVVADATLARGLLDRHLGDLLQVVNLERLKIYDPVSQLCLGYTEILGSHTHRIVFNTTPASPYRILTLDDADYDRLDSGSSTLTSGITSSATSFQVSTSEPGDLWTTAAGDFPLDIAIGGERIRISGITGATSPQTFTVDTGGRAVNGVAKAHSAGAEVHVADRNYLGL